MKKIMIFTIIFLATGCSSNYTLNIKNDSIEETVNINIPTTVAGIDTINQSVDIERPVYGSDKEVYTVDVVEKENNNIVKYSYNHDSINKYTTSNFITKCYNTTNIESTDEQIIIKTDKRFNCIYMEDGFYMDSVTINIKTDLKVVENNADSIEDNTYTWYINKNNYQNKPLKMVIEKPLNYEKTIEKASNSPIFIIGIIIFFLLLGLLIAILIKKYNTKNNEI